MKSPVRCCLAAVFSFSLLSIRLVAESGSGLPTLTTTAQVHALSPEEARCGYPVAIRGVVTFYDQKYFNTCFVHDDTGSISLLTTDKQYRLSVGERVEVRGVSDPGHFAPMIRALDITSLGPGEVPAPRRVSYETIATGREDSEWVELEGIVRAAWEDKAAARLIIEIATGGGRLMTRVRDYDRTASYSSLVDAVVRVRGVCSQLFNEKRQMFNVRLLVPSVRDDVVVIAPAPAPFAAPVRSIVSLMQFAPQGIYGRRVRVQGTVTFQQPGRALFIRDETQSLLVHTTENIAVAPGDRVDVAGFPAMGEWTPVLQDAAFRKLGSAPTPAPAAAVTTAQALTGSHNDALVQIDGTVMDCVERMNEEILVIASAGVTFEATLEKEGRESRLAGFQKGSKVRLTGINIVEVGEGRAPRAFRLLLRSPGDVVLLARPPWWTLGRLLWMLGGVSLTMLAGYVWVAALGRRVRQQTGIIAEKIQREAALEERARLAREFHDTLEQQFNGIRLQLEAVKLKFTESPAEAQGYLDVAHLLICHSHAEARRSVWDLRADVLEHHDLSAALAETVGPVSESRPPVRVEVIGEPRRLPGWMENHLLRIGQEAVTNAVKHAQATEVQIELAFQEDALRMRVRDNGCGFKTGSSRPGHFGLLGMKERANKMCGHLTVLSTPGTGTTIEVCVPFAAAATSLSSR